MPGSMGPPLHTNPRTLPPLFDGNAPAASGSAATPSPSTSMTFAAHA